MNLWDEWQSPFKDDRGLFRGGEEERFLGRFRDEWEDRPSVSGRWFGESAPTGFPLLDMFVGKIGKLFKDIL